MFKTTRAMPMWHDMPINYSKEKRCFCGTQIFPRMANFIHGHACVKVLKK
jgi:hypothetical protein